MSSKNATKTSIQWGKWKKCKKRRNWTRYWRRIVRLTWWVNVWKIKKHQHYQVILIFVFGRKWMSIFVFLSFSVVNGISFSSVFSFTAENEKCFSVGLWYTSQKGLGLGLEKVLITSLSTFYTESVGSNNILTWLKDLSTQVLDPKQRCRIWDQAGSGWI